MLMLLSLQPASQETPLPEIGGFKGDVVGMVDMLLRVGDNVQNKTFLDRGELVQYTYTEKEIRTKLDSKGIAKESETGVYEVTRGPEWWQFYRKQISRDGVSLSAAELSKQDIAQRQREKEQREEIARAVKQAQKAAEKQKVNPKPEVSLTLEEQKKSRDDLLFHYFEEVFDIAITHRQTIDGHPSVLIAMQPKHRAKTKDDLLKMLQHVAIRGWITEPDHQLVRLEADVVETISLGLGFLAKFQKGSRLLLERRTISPGLWAVTKVDATLNARILLLKGLRERQVSEYSDFKKFTVETTLQVIEGDGPE